MVPCDNFPLGVKTMYRRASAESIIEIVEDSNATCGVYPQRADVFWFPQKDEASGIDVDGMYILQQLPTQLPKPMPFVENSLYDLEEICKEIQVKFGVNYGKTVTAWEEFAKSAPNTNDVDSYVREHPLHIPFADILFGGAPVDTTPIVLHQQEVEDNMKRVRCTDCVQWSRRGVHRRANDAENYGRLETVYDQDGEAIMINAMPRKVITTE